MTVQRLALQPEHVEVVDAWQVTYRRERELEAAGFDEDDEDVPAMWLDYHAEDEHTERVAVVAPPPRRKLIIKAKTP